LSAEAGSVPTAGRAAPRGRLRALEGLAAVAGAKDLVRQAGELAERTAEGRFFLACVGQVKRGKSTLLNALLGRPILPAGVVPVTSAVTVLRHGPRLSARVSFADGGSEDIAAERIGEFVSEAENPENRKGVLAVEVFVPSPLLAGGMCLVDTPGLGSVFGGNAAVTRAFVPHIDAALVVIGADPPISGEELRLVEEVAAHVRHIVVALNKADRLSDRERQEGTRFAARVLSERLRRPMGTIHQVSAVERLERGEPTRDWKALEDAVSALAHEAGADLVQAAEARGFERLARALLRELSERRDALVRPAEESERRLAALRKSVAAAERAMEDLAVLLGAEQARLARGFRETQEAHHPRALEEALPELEVRIRALACSRARLRSRSYDAAQAVAREAVDRWRAGMEPVAEKLYQRATDRFVELANEFLARVASSGEPGMDALPRTLEAEAGFRVESRLCYTLLMDLTTNQFDWLLDLLRPREWTLRALVTRVGRYLDEILLANSSRVANDLAERVAGSRARLEADLHGILRQVTEVAERAIARAQARRAEGEAAVKRELEDLESLTRQTEDLLQQPSTKGTHT
jgi:predicted GTPase